MEINFKNETNEERAKASRLSVLFSPALFYRLRTVTVSILISFLL